MSDIIVVTAATGNIGRALAEELLAQRRNVRVVGRSGERLKSLTDMGAEAAVGSLEDAEFAEKAFAGAKAVFSLIPPNYQKEPYREYQGKVGEAIAKGIEKNSVRFVVNLSSIGANLTGGTGFIAGLYDHEQRLKKLKGLNVVHLRAAFFMENHLWSIGAVKQQGAAGGALKGDIAIPQVATRDIAAAAARLLSSLSFTGSSVRYVLGPRDLSLNESWAILGRAIGKPDLRYVQIPYEELRKMLPGLGFSGGAADSYIEMIRAFNEGRVRPTQARSPENTTTTTMEEFSKTFAAAFQAPAPV